MKTTCLCVDEGDLEIFGLTDNLLPSLSNVWGKSGVNNDKLHIKSEARQLESASLPDKTVKVISLTCSSVADWGTVSCSRSFWCAAGLNHQTYNYWMTHCSTWPCHLYNLVWSEEPGPWWYCQPATSQIQLTSHKSRLWRGQSPTHFYYISRHRWILSNSKIIMGVKCCLWLSLLNSQMFIFSKIQSEC